MDIQYLQIVDSTCTQASKTVTFKTQFLNVPKITYNLLKIKTNIEYTIGFEVNTISVSNTQLQVEIKAKPGHTLYNIRIGILATDFPNSVQFQGTFNKEGSQTFTAPGKIVGYCAFVYAYVGDIAFAIIQFKFSSQVNGQQLQLYYDETLGGNMKSIDFNALAIYETNQPWFQLYSFKFTTSSEFSLSSFVDDKSYSQNTQLSEQDQIFYGMGYWNDHSNFEYNFEVNQSNSQQIITNSKINLKIYNHKGYISWLTISVFELMIRYCPPSNFIIKVGSDYQCVSDCSAVDISTYNDSINNFPLDYSTYKMNSCSPCHSSCYSCSGPQNTNCNSCHSNQYYDETNNVCLDNQPNQTFCQQVNKNSQSYQSCQPCNQTCKTCSGGGINQCITCSENYPYSYNRLCVNDQQVGVFCDNVTKTCKDCLISNCKKCDSTLQQCLLCIDTWYLFNNTCYNSKQDHTYCDNNNICQLCDQSKCVNCIDSLDKCTQCQNGQYLLENVCYSSQQQYTFCNYNQILIQYDCVRCSQNCSKCSGQQSNQCSECLAGKYFNNNQCFDNQQTGTYCDSNLICYPCDKSCQECTAGMDNNCTSCFKNQYLYQNTCSSTKQSGTYCDQNLVCKDCDLKKCVTCVDAPDKCTSCQNDQYLFNGVCYNNQPDKTFCLDLQNNEIFKRCSACFQSCANCSGDQPNQYDTCISGYFFYQNQCFQVKPPSTYCDQNNICQKCHDECKECLGPYKNQCTSCLSQQFLYKSQCFNQQPGFTYCDQDFICFDCDSKKCLTCQNSSDFCLSCQAQQYFFNNKCYNQNPNGAFCKNVSNLNYQTCEKCSENCKFCTGPDPQQCQECNDQIYFYKNTCSLIQPKQTYCENFICHECDASCKSCTGPTSTQCSECYDGYYLNQSKQENTCQVCQKGCSLCQNFFDNCSSCQNPYYLKENKCLLDCKRNEYFDLQERICSSCSEYCQTCSDKTIKGCLSCIDSANLNSNNQCICSQQGFGLSSDGTQCLPCQTSRCKSCEHSNKCDICIENAYLNVESNGEEKCICKEGYFYSQSYQKCQKCPQKNCKACSDDGKSCLKCLDGFHYNKGYCQFCSNYKFANEKNECEMDCPNLCQACSNQSECSMYLINEPNYFPKELCHFSCKECSSSKDTACLLCSSQTREYNLQTQKCECKQNYIENGQQDCKKIQQVDSLLVEVHQKLNIISFPVQTLGLFLINIPSVMYQYQIQQLIGDLSFINHTDYQQNSINNVLKLYTKYNSFEIFNKKESQDSTSNPTLRVSRILSSDQNTQILQNKDTFLAVELQESFFQASFIPLSALALFLIICACLHLYELKTQIILKYTYLFKWNIFILLFVITSNFLIISLFNLSFQKQQLIDFVFLGLFGVFYTIFLVWITYKCKKAEQQDQSYQILKSSLDTTSFIGRYYFLLIEVKKIVFCSIISLAFNYVKFSVWAIVFILILEILVKKWVNPFSDKISLYFTLLTDILFAVLIILYGVFLNSKDEQQLVLIATLVLIFLMIFTICSLCFVAFLVIKLIKNKKNTIKEKLDLSYYTSTTRRSISQSFNLEMKNITTRVKWQKNPIQNINN
ncbi:H-type lectin domain protein (macronuclear) [Tetrahymena thermophila SB210]|uniref:H-type lectin domain protein n=1 Tax=Tetrahymena thermophila (strain SB210) TaxID=312017 RepID=Q23C36_TETTS|nr:H-type lectin domain protein [Tetrahymena thermophila SB210]EAR93932.2 H-type lectin domain protein [Tetrahymena thermophila SB210]|eukprot:XP_001014177.2 H-type lectin domain protein [Tetrahymena thermophila SB210]